MTFKISAKGYTGGDWFITSPILSYGLNCESLCYCSEKDCDHAIACMKQLGGSYNIYIYINI